MSKGVSRRLFCTPDDEGDKSDDQDDEPTQFRKRIQKTFEADELKKQDSLRRRKRENGMTNNRELKVLKRRSRGLERKSRKSLKCSSSFKKKKRFLKMIFATGVLRKKEKRRR